MNYTDMNYTGLCIKLFILGVIYWILLIADAGLAGKENREEWKKTKNYPPGIILFTILTYLSFFASMIMFAMSVLTW